MCGFTSVAHSAHEHILKAITAACLRAHFSLNAANTADTPCVWWPCRMKRYFRDWRLRALFTFQDLYVGLSPWSAPGVYSLLAGTELTDGVW